MCDRSQAISSIRTATAMKTMLKAVTPVILTTILIAGITIAWFWISQQVRTGLAAERARLTDELKLSCASEDWGGWPFKVELTCIGPQLEIAGTRAVISGTQLVGFTRIYNLRTTVLEWYGPTEITDATARGRTHLTHAPAVARITTRDDLGLAATLTAAALAVRYQEQDIVSMSEFSLSAIFTPGNATTVDTRFEGRDIVAMPAASDRVAIDQLAISAAADNIPRQPVPDVETWLKAAAAMPTRFRIVEFQTMSGNTALSATGEVVIADTGHLDGAIRTHVRNLKPALDTMAQRKFISDKSIGAINTLLPLFDKGDGVKADLIFRKGEVYWGPIRLGTQIALF